MLRTLECSFLLFTVTLFAGVVEDEAQIEEISDFRTCVDTFSAVIGEKIHNVDKGNFERAESSVTHLLSSLSHRILEEKRDFIIKIPDYDKPLDCWPREDPSFFDGGWDFEGIDFLRNLIKNKAPSFITKELRKIVGSQ